MKHNFLKSLFLLIPFFGFSQSYIGYNQDNYSGVHGITQNPATVVGSPYRLDFNLVSANGMLSNDFLSTKLSNLFKNDFDFDTHVKKTLAENNNAIVNTEVLGPSFMFNIAPKHSIGVFTKARAIMNIVGLKGTLYEAFIEELEPNRDYRITEDGFNLSMNSWAETGLTYGTVLLNNGKHVLKGGVSLKYLQGFANSYSYGKKIDFFYDSNLQPIPNVVKGTGDFVYGGTDNFEKSVEEFNLNPNSSGFGADLGFVYELRRENDKPSYVPNYNLKFGVSVTDIGSMTYKNNTEKAYKFQDVTIDQTNVDKTEDLVSMLQLFDPNPETRASVKTNLPTALHANVDWNFFRKFYLNVNADLSMVDKNQLNQNSIANTFSITPRFESKWFSFYLPINHMEYRGTMVGTGLRLGPLFVGSGSVLTNLFSESKGADVYFGLKIPIYKGEKKVKEIKVEKVKPVVAVPVKEEVKVVVSDTDGDGLLDDVDECPNEQGPKINKGCPYKDEDKDGIVDSEDKCPSIAGPVENLGCPWPDTDGDGVLDKDDKCINVIGTIKNNGCPEVTEAVVKKLNDYAKTILFDAGKDTFQQVTYPVLEAMSALLNEYPTAKFSIEGHTDGDGPAPANLTLSEARATAVMAYLVEKGIDVSRLKATGYGETKPIAPNNTKAGKALNRRVEVKLMQ